MYNQTGPAAIDCSQDSTFGSAILAALYQVAVDKPSTSQDTNTPKPATRHASGIACGIPTSRGFCRTRGDAYAS
eukprot:4255914-Amphidinium_carterae.1